MPMMGRFNTSIVPMMIMFSLIVLFPPQAQCKYISQSLWVCYWVYGRISLFLTNWIPIASGRKQLLVVGSKNIHLNDPTNIGYNATTIDSMTIDNQGKAGVTLCLREQCNHKDCYCCSASKSKCYDTRDKCLNSCPLCNPRCSSNDLLN